MDCSVLTNHCPGTSHVWPIADLQPTQSLRTLIRLQASVPTKATFHASSWLIAQEERISVRVLTSHCKTMLQHSLELLWPSSFVTAPGFGASASLAWRF